MYFVCESCNAKWFAKKDLMQCPRCGELNSSREDIVPPWKMFAAREVTEKLDRIEELLVTLLKQKTVKEWYSISEVAEILGKAEFTVREHARLGRIDARKVNGRGEYGEWRVSHAELVRVQNEGLLPDPSKRQLRPIL
jgi:hypothetical protein